MNWKPERALQIIAGTPPGGGLDRVARALAKAGAPDRYHTSFYDGPHKFDREMQKEAFAWFDRWLKG